MPLNAQNTPPGSRIFDALNNSVGCPSGRSEIAAEITNGLMVMRIHKASFQILSDQIREQPFFNGNRVRISAERNSLLVLYRFLNLRTYVLDQ